MPSQKATGAHLITQTQSPEVTIQLFPNSFLIPYREVNENGKDWLVVNGVPLVEGVLNGRYVAAEEFGAFVHGWNDVPLVMRHPKKNGGSARVPSPDVTVVGRFYNAKMDGKRLTGQYWLDKNALLSTPEGELILSKIYAGTPVETSTGYFSASYKEAGQWNGKDFTLVDREIKPDHIAILPDEIGACSVKDGCGLVRNQMQTNCQSCEHSQELVTNMTGKLPDSGKKQWEEVYQAALKAGDDKETAAKKAWGAMKSSGWSQDAKGEWMMKANQICCPDLVEQFVDFAKL